MVICSKCGAGISQGALFCEICGQQVSSVPGEAKSAFEDENISPLDADIRLADDLAAKYAALDKIKEEITDTEFAMKKCEVSSTPPRYSTFRFFWPFFIIALGASFVVTLITALIAASADSDFGIAVAEILGYLSIPVVLLIGLFVAKARRNAANEELEAKERTMMRKSDDMHRKVVELRNMQGDITIELSMYKDKVPAPFRNKNQMLRVKSMLETGKAQSFDEAIEMLARPQKY